MIDLTLRFFAGAALGLVGFIGALLGLGAIEHAIWNPTPRWFAMGIVATVLGLSLMAAAAMVVAGP